ncbi:MAG: sulfite exporter TauE/SafE family protein, partial [Pseudomonadota bacterium]
YFGMQVDGRPASSLGFIYLPAMLVVSLASVTTAPLGARTAHALPIKSLRKVFALTLYLLAAYMFWKGVKG